MKPGYLLLSGFAVYLLVLLATVPGTVADACLRHASNGRLRIALAQGTLWAGTGQLEIRNADGRAVAGKSMVWRLQPGALLRAQLSYAVALDAEPTSFPVIISWSQIELANVSIRMPAAALGDSVPRLAPLALSGEVDILVSSFAFGRNGTRGSATLQWLTASSALSKVAPLGDYQFRFEGTGPEVKISLQTLKGPLQLDGQGSWASARQPVFLAIAHMPPQVQPQLAPFLRLIAAERGDGSFAWQLK